MPVQDAFDALPIMNLGKGTVLGCIAGALTLVLTFSLTGCNGRCLTTPALGRGQMGHALRVTEAGATPQKP